MLPLHFGKSFFPTWQGFTNPLWPLVSRGLRQGAADGILFSLFQFVVSVRVTMYRLIPLSQQHKNSQTNQRGPRWDGTLGLKIFQSNPGTCRNGLKRVMNAPYSVIGVRCPRVTRVSTHASNSNNPRVPHERTCLLVLVIRILSWIRIPPLRVPGPWTLLPPRVILSWWPLLWSDIRQQ
jgi:hypothetical protein